MSFGSANGKPIKYGLQLRAPPNTKPKALNIQPPSAFFNADDDDDVEQEIARHASAKSSLKDVEQQHKKALDEDPSIFDYDGVYDSIKAKITKPLQQDRQERKPKYIEKLIAKSNKRKQEQEIIYEKQLLKERSKEDHLYAGKEKFVTSAYKKKLEEQAKWLEEEKQQELREQKEDVTKKTDMGDFYRNLLKKNVAFGANLAKAEDAYIPQKYIQKEKEIALPEHSQKEDISEQNNDKSSLKRKMSDRANDISDSDNSVPAKELDLPKSIKTSHSVEREKSHSVEREESQEGPSLSKPLTEEKGNITQPDNVSDAKAGGSTSNNVPERKQGQDALAAARERYLARKKMKEGGVIYGVLFAYSMMEVGCSMFIMAVFVKRALESTKALCSYECCTD